jgi:tRNA 5-methylaminomethyl-2-thiouridine biosynthesis bifunctional protein
VEVTSLENHPHGVDVRCSDGELWYAQHVVIANAYAANHLLPEPLPMRHIRGQITYLPAHYVSQHIEHVYCYGGYITPAIDGIHYLGATFEKERSDTQVDTEGHRTNIATLRAQLPEMLVDDIPIETLEGRAALRTVSGDRLPIIGSMAHSVPLCARIYVSLAHGARGLVSAPLAGEVVAQNIVRSPVALLSEQVQKTFAPERFMLRAQKRKLSIGL